MSTATEASTRSARSVKKLYGALLRLGRKWPVSETRKDRSLWEAIPRVTRTRFGMLKTGLAAPQVKTYGEAGVKELESLRRLQDNTHFKKYALKGNYEASFMAKLTRDMDDDLLILSSQYQEKEQGTYFGGDMKYLSKLFDEKEDKIQESRAKAEEEQAEADNKKPL